MHKRNIDAANSQFRMGVSNGFEMLYRAHPSEGATWAVLWPRMASHVPDAARAHRGAGHSSGEDRECATEK
ncbi:hypothetical protein [Sedimentitalea todarodis]|uniref:Uncharacterized protein n=1 Tax=Sedimentitalea todarodis TaxID=1631240 RepID=A0ABU3VC72_9RHOB|nr:hypothetical protein [Sedimentitalea todarodis]MDU9003673.1 hypothetical protein [Sedimentitalea todarodis]